MPSLRSSSQLATLRIFLVNSSSLSRSLEVIDGGLERLELLTRKILSVASWEELLSEGSRSAALPRGS